MSGYLTYGYLSQDYLGGYTMTDLTKLIFVNTDGDFEEAKSTDSVKFASFKTANYEMTDTLLGKLVNAISSSAGAGDSGKFVILDADGNIDATMINDGDISHDSTDGVAASTAHTAFPLLAGGRAFTAIQTYDSHPTFNADTQIVDKKYVDDVAASLGTQAEWQDSCLDEVLDPTSLTPSSGDRYLINGTGAGAWSGHDNEIAEWDGSAWQYTSPSTGMYTSVDDTNDALFYYSGSAWVKKYYESTTASLGCKKVGLDIQADLLANGGLALSTNSLYVMVDDSSIEKDGSGNLQVKADGINDTHIDFGTGANQVSAADLPIADSAGYLDATEVESALAELYELAQEGTAIEYTASGAISKGDLVYLVGNDQVSTMPISASNRCIGIALSSVADTEAVEVVAMDAVISGVLTTATAGTRYYWDGSALTTTIPAGSGSYVWQAGVAKNATDLVAMVEFVKKNA